MDEKLQKFQKARMPIRVAAEALGMDPQTVRVMIQMGVVSWGKAFKLPKSKKYSYVISPKSFFEETGFLWNEESEHRSGERTDSVRTVGDTDYV